MDTLLAAFFLTSAVLMGQGVLGVGVMMLCSTSHNGVTLALSILS